MDEYIELGAAIALIREQGIYGEGHSDEERENDVISMLESIPAADVVEVVRCRDCKHMQFTEVKNRYCRAWGRIQTMGDDGFCNFGERKDGEP